MGFVYHPQPVNPGFLFTINTINQKRKLSIFQPFYLFFWNKNFGFYDKFVQAVKLVNELVLLLDYYQVFLLPAKGGIGSI